MSALGQKQTCAMHQPMSALLPKRGQALFTGGFNPAGKRVQLRADQRQDPMTSIPGGHAVKAAQFHRDD
jgi:hypothetical protein